MSVLQLLSLAHIVTVHMPRVTPPLVTRTHTSPGMPQSALVVHVS
jgi:hypothetical protein